MLDQSIAFCIRSLGFCFPISKFLVVRLIRVLQEIQKVNFCIPPNIYLSTVMCKVVEVLYLRIYSSVFYLALFDRWGSNFCLVWFSQKAAEPQKLNFDGASG